MLIVWLLVGLATSPLPPYLENINVEDGDFSLLSQPPDVSLGDGSLPVPPDGSEFDDEEIEAALEQARKGIKQIVSELSDKWDPSFISANDEIKSNLDVLPQKVVEVDTDKAFAEPDEIIKGSLPEHDPHNLNSKATTPAPESGDKELPHPSEMKPSILQTIYINILRCRQQGDIVFSEYITMYRHLNTFLSSFGSFARVQTQMLEERIKSLELRHRGVNRAEYQTLTRMIRFEDAGDTFADIDPFSGSIVFTCLQRHLQYLSLALHAIIPLEEKEPLLHPFETAYRTILAKHHNWFVEKFYLLGMAMLPTKAQAVRHLRERDGEDVTMDELMGSLQLIVRELDELTEATEAILESSGVLEKIPTQVVT